MAKGAYKSAEEMNSERRQRKLAQKHGGKKKQQVEGFSMRDLISERERAENADRNRIHKMRAVMHEADSVLAGTGLEGAATLVRHNDEFYLELRQMIQNSNEYVLIEASNHKQLWWWPRRSSKAQAA